MTSTWKRTLKIKWDRKTKPSKNNRTWQGRTPKPFGAETLRYKKARKIWLEKRRG